MADQTSIVEYYAEHEGYKCGYCGQSNSNYSHGMWAHTMTVHDYQDLIDRGWRRSGQYVYKPTMDRTCCPHYTIRCEVLNFKPNKSHKKLLKKNNNYFNFGTSKDAAARNNAKEDEVDGAMASKIDGPSNCGEERLEMSVSKKSKSTFNPGVGADSSKPQCRKAKLVRQELKKKKISTETSKEFVAKKEIIGEKSLEDFLAEIIDNPAHKLEIKLVRSNPPDEDFERTFKETYQLYKRYQMVIHNDPPSKPSERQFRRFLVNSPLQPFYKNEGGVESGYGSFHQQYWLDGKLIIVGVIDILPKCISSVYLFYDPDQAFLSPGTFSALRELAFTRALNKQDPELIYYYLGFYIHSCPKMTYKGQYVPSYLLCPEVYTWHPIEECKPLLHINKYSRFEKPGKEDPNGSIDVDKVMVLYERQMMPYSVYKALKFKGTAVRDKMEVKQYASLVGKTCSQKILLYRSS
ncbi:arginyl-tRNA--protein transferase 1-like isoform X2 [Tubulanus polymorphus]|uniref:arginyl-tRNA--protein transferase 1-like isoform X2 n=1 Tax=Tubulanus polymorphus TaxID=672921 RepID=UPI003DA54E07